MGLQLAKKLAVLGWIYRNGLITDDEYMKSKRILMSKK